MPAAPPVVLTIAGFDPSSGAGITADLKTFAAHQCYGLACITAVTVQSTRGVRRVQPLPAKLVTEMLTELAGDFEIAAVKIGMLATANVARAVLRFLEKRRAAHVVLDPVLRSSSGTALLQPDGIPVLGKMLALAEVITPNVREAGILAGMRISTMENVRRAAERLHELGAQNVVITGGDFEQVAGKAIDVFSIGDGRIEEFGAPRLASRNTHGTGCAFASAIAANLAQGMALRDSVAAAKGYVAEAIRTSAPLSIGRRGARLGHGRGPLNHFLK